MSVMCGVLDNPIAWVNLMKLVCDHILRLFSILSKRGGCFRTEKKILKIGTDFNYIWLNIASKNQKRIGCQLSKMPVSGLSTKTSAMNLL